MPKCPICLEDIDYLFERREVAVCNKATLTEDDELDYQRLDDEDDLLATDASLFECPQCERIILRGEDNAISFLKGAL